MKKRFFLAVLALAFFAGQAAFAQDDGANVRTPLMQAVEKGNLVEIQALLDQGADPNAGSNEPPLLGAVDCDARFFRIEVVKLLLSAKGIDVNKFGTRAEGSYSWTRTALHAAAKNGYTEAVKLLLESGAKVDPKDRYIPDQTLWGPGPLDTPLILAAEGGYAEIAAMLLDKGANVNYKNAAGETPLMSSMTLNTISKTPKVKADALKVVQLLLDKGAKVDTLSVPDKPIYKKYDLPTGSSTLKDGMMLQNGTGISALHIAANFSLIEAATLLLDKGANIEITDYGNLHTPLFMATQRNQAAMVTFLLGRKANAEATDTAGTSCLLMAAAGLYAETTTALLKGGADPNAGKTLPNALMYAINQGPPDKEGQSLKVMKILLDKGIDVNYQNAQGVSPLMTASGWGIVPKSPARAKLLLDKGADPNLVDKQGQTALMFAAYRGYYDIAKLLIDKGADVDAKNSVGRTALMIASTAVTDLQGLNGDFARIVKLLLDKGADVNAMDKDKNSALSLATRYKRTQAIALLTASGATLEGTAKPVDNSKAVLGTWEGTKNQNPYAIYRFTFREDMTWTCEVRASASFKKEYPSQFEGMDQSLKSQLSMEGTEGSFSFREQYLILKVKSGFSGQKVYQWQVVDGKLKLNGGEYSLTKVSK